MAKTYVLQAHTGTTTKLNLTHIVLASGNLEPKNTSNNFQARKSPEPDWNHSCIFMFSALNGRFWELPNGLNNIGGVTLAKPLI